MVGNLEHEMALLKVESFNRYMGQILEGVLYCANGIVCKPYDVIYMRRMA